MKPEEYIADLVELKSHLIKPLSYDSRVFAEPNITYVLIETLIAVFIDKYKVDYRKVTEVLNERRFASQDIPNT